MLAAARVGALLPTEAAAPTVPVAPDDRHRLATTVLDPFDAPTAHVGQRADAQQDRPARGDGAGDAPVNRNPMARGIDGSGSAPERYGRQSADRPGPRDGSSPAPERYGRQCSRSAWLRPSVALPDRAQIVRLVPIAPVPTGRVRRRDRPAQRPSPVATAGSVGPSSRRGRGAPRRPSGTRDRFTRGDRDAPQRKPPTAAERRAMPRSKPSAVRPVGGAERTPAEPAPWERESWVDDGPIRAVAREASQRARTVDPAATDPAVSRARSCGRNRNGGRSGQHRSAPQRRTRSRGSRRGRDARPGVQRSARYHERLTSAAEALERGRFDDARRMVQPVLRDLPNVATAHEIAGLAFYSTGSVAQGRCRTRDWRANSTDRCVTTRCWPTAIARMRRYDTVAELWAELKAASPAPALMAEGRIVAAGALADQGDLRGALRLLERARDTPKKVREHHLRQWYVLGDLLDRSGDIIEARRFFGLVAQADSEFADVVQRLASLGR